MESNWKIHSLKHGGRHHRMWQESKRVPDELLPPAFREEGMSVFVSSRTEVTEADGSRWTTRQAAVSLFPAACWYNIVALPAEGKLSYYCNLASPPILEEGTIRYTDYDLDVLVSPEGTVTVVDEEEFALHANLYGYPPSVREQVMGGLEHLQARIRRREAPFDKEDVIWSYLALLGGEEGRSEEEARHGEGSDADSTDVGLETDGPPSAGHSLTRK